MIYTTEKNYIKVWDKSQFDPQHILECGQIFRYKKTLDGYTVYSLDLKANIVEKKDCYHIYSSDLRYFEIFFDLRNDYRRIKQELYKTPFMRKPLAFGSGIRILKQDIFETIVNFIISANNNIKRIQKSIEYLCTNFGKNMGEYYAFPTFEEIQKLSVQDYIDAGLGYRAEQLYKSINLLKFINTAQLKSFDYDQKRKVLKSLVGVGDKVADCILLFAFGECGAFPVDTWIHQMYNATYNDDENNRNIIAEKLKSEFGELSGYAQQYLFYYFRSSPDSKV